MDHNVCSHSHAPVPRQTLAINGMEWCGQLLVSPVIGDVGIGAGIDWLGDLCLLGLFEVNGALRFASSRMPARSVGLTPSLRFDLNPPHGEAGDEGSAPHVLVSCRLNHKSKVTSGDFEEASGKPGRGVRGCPQVMFPVEVHIVFHSLRDLWANTQSSGHPVYQVI